MNIQDKLFSMQDKTYQEFSRKLIPNIAPEKIIGVRTPALRQLAKEILAARKSLSILQKGQVAPLIELTFTLRSSGSTPEK